MGEPNQVREWQRAAQDPKNAMKEAQEAVFVAMGGRGNTPYVCIANAIDEAAKALQMGLPADELDCMPDIKRLPGDERYIEAYRIVATAVEAEAMRRQVAEREPVTA